MSLKGVLENVLWVRSEILSKEDYKRKLFFNSNFLVFSSNM